VIPSAIGMIQSIGLSSNFGNLGTLRVIDVHDAYAGCRNESNRFNLGLDGRSYGRPYSPIVCENHDLSICHSPALVGETLSGSMIR